MNLYEPIYMLSDGIDTSYHTRVHVQVIAYMVNQNKLGCLSHIAMDTRLTIKRFNKTYIDSRFRQRIMSL